MGKISYQKIYRSVKSQALMNETITFPLLMAVIVVDKGVVQVSYLS